MTHSLLLYVYIVKLENCFAEPIKSKFCWRYVDDMFNKMIIFKKDLTISIQKLTSESNPKKFLDIRLIYI